MVAITGGLAMSNSSRDDDIDFFIITAKNRLWLTRLSVIIFLEILGKRRRPRDKRFKNKICPNLFLDETVLSLSKGKRNLFTAHEICQMKPIFNKDNTYEKFLKVNLWVKEHLPNGIKNLEPRTKNKGNMAKSKKSPKFNVLSSIFLFLEKLAYRFQVRYMKSKKTNEDVSPSFAFFHPQDQTISTLKLYKNKKDKIR
jgi:hypothetical protein